MGSPEFAVPALRALHAAGHDIVAVYTQAPKPAGRGHAVRPCAVQAAAEALGLAVRTPRGLRRDLAEQEHFAGLGLDAAVVAAYGLILPPAMLAAPRAGCLNIHASLLPRWRGAAPVQAAIRAGDAETGITIMRMDEGLDTGAMLLSEAVPITDRTTTPDLLPVLAGLGAALVLRALAQNPTPVPQDPARATYAPKLSRADARVDWTLPADAIDCQVRALTPWPGTETLLNGGVLKILAAEPVPGAGPPGTVLDDALCIACGSGALRLTRVQAPGKPAMAAADFLRGHAVPVGNRLG